ncbi:unnamed protein product [Dovyalis caffra]|uniref:Uncharacterized protein n=1 Tax=Dovyalis caffra TaxID=77055 RepID=A0AAV1SP65_9ROSI|nr:unnamed protein product [Dovyalis caffra]
MINYCSINGFFSSVDFFCNKVPIYRMKLQTMRRVVLVLVSTGLSLETKGTKPLMATRDVHRDGLRTGLKVHGSVENGGLAEQGAVHRDGLRTGLKVHGSVENGGLVKCFFGKDGKASLEHDRFVQFMRDLNNEEEFYVGGTDEYAKMDRVSHVYSMHGSKLHIRANE